MERIAHKAKNYQEADDWDIDQQTRMTPTERQAIARRLKERAYGRSNKDVRECHQTP